LAGQLLDQAGYAERKDIGVLFLTYNEGLGHRSIAGKVARQLSEAGISLQPVEVEWDYYQKQLAQMQYSFFRVGWTADYADADDFLVHLYHSRNSGVSNYNGYYNPQVDQLLEQSRAEADQAERVRLLQKAEDLILDDAPQLWLFQRQSNKAVSPAIKHFYMNALEVVDWQRVEITPTRP
jgi:peptide/nickel transport system substrate-binding protein/oligopeptide transport system substrate-binding protein